MFQFCFKLNMHYTIHEALLQIPFFSRTTKARMTSATCAARTPISLASTLRPHALTTTISPWRWSSTAHTPMALGTGGATRETTRRFVVRLETVESQACLACPTTIALDYVCGVLVQLSTRYILTRRNTGKCARNSTRSQNNEDIKQYPPRLQAHVVHPTG